MTCSKVFLCAFLFFIQTSVSFAFPQDTFKTKKDCAYCHKAKKGGGALNDAGVYYQKHGNLVGYQSQEVIKKAQVEIKKIKKAERKKKKPPVVVAKKKKQPPKIAKKPPVVVAKKSEEKPKQKEPVIVAERPKTPERSEKEETYWTRLWNNTDFFADVRFWSMLKKGGPMARSFFFMEAHPGVTVEFVKNLSTTLAFNIPQPLLTAFLKYEFVPKHYVQGGLFRVPMGMGYEDHTVFLIDQLHVGTDTREAGAMIGSDTDLFYKFAVTTYKRFPKMHVRALSTITQSDAVYTANVGYKGKTGPLDSLFGLSFMYEQGAQSSGALDRDAQIYDGYLWLTWKKLSLFGETAYAVEKPTIDRDSLSFYAGLQLQLIPQLSFVTRYEYYIEDIQFSADATHRAVLGGRWQFFKYAALESYFRYEDSFNAGTNINPSNTFFVMGHLFY